MTKAYAIMDVQTLEGPVFTLPEFSKRVLYPWVTYVKNEDGGTYEIYRWFPSLEELKAAFELQFKQEIDELTEAGDEEAFAFTLALLSYEVPENIPVESVIEKFGLIKEATAETVVVEDTNFMVYEYNGVGFILDEEVDTLIPLHKEVTSD